MKYEELPVASNGHRQELQFCKCPQLVANTLRHRDGIRVEEYGCRTSLGPQKCKFGRRPCTPDFAGAQKPTVVPLTRLIVKEGGSEIAIRQGLRMELEAEHLQRLDYLRADARERLLLAVSR